jgi:hypothetical protein
VSQDANAIGRIYVDYCISNTTDVGVDIAMPEDLHPANAGNYPVMLSLTDQHGAEVFAKRNTHTNGLGWEWAIDTGAQLHMVVALDWFYSPLPPGRYTLRADLVEGSIRAADRLPVKLSQPNAVEFTVRDSGERSRLDADTATWMAKHSWPPAAIEAIAMLGATAKKSLVGHYARVLRKAHTRAQVVHACLCLKALKLVSADQTLRRAAAGKIGAPGLVQAFARSALK